MGSPGGEELSRTRSSDGTDDVTDDEPPSDPSLAYDVEPGDDLASLEADESYTTPPLTTFAPLTTVPTTVRRYLEFLRGLCPEKNRKVGFTKSQFLRTVKMMSCRVGQSHYSHFG